MQQVITEKLIVVKSSALNENQGFVIPVLAEQEDGSYRRLSRDEYPSDILITKGFPAITEQYEAGELFVLSNHYLDETKEGLKYRAYFNDVEKLPQNTFLPVLITELPDKQAGLLPLDVVPPSQPFFILDNQCVYGPLSSTQTDDKRYMVEPFVHPLLSFGKGYLGKFNYSEVLDTVVDVFVNGVEKKFITSFKAISKYKPGNSGIDYLSDDQLIRVVNAQGFGKKSKVLAKKEAERLQQFIADSEKENQIIKQDERVERLKKLLDKYLVEADFGYSLIKEYLGSSAGQRFLQTYVEENKLSLLQEHLEKVKEEADEKEQEIKLKLQKLSDTFLQKETQLHDFELKIELKKKEVEEDIAKIEAEKEETIKKRLEEQQHELSKEIESAKLDLSNIVNDIENQSKELGIFNETVQLNKRKSYLEEHNKMLESAANGFVNTLQTTSNQDLAKKIGEMEAINKVLSGQSYLETTSLEAKPIVFAKSQPENAEDLIDSLCHEFSEDGGRAFSQEEMTNLLVSVNQSFLTVLSGPPGTGKTSTATRLAEALHLGSSQGDKNFLFVPVGRGWVSSRDTLGFYNSLKGVYQESRTGLYNFLQRDGNQANKLILLDEANLSSMEHYWSDFIGHCDSDYGSRPIDTGIPKEDLRFLKLDESVRFIATINNDATTERLSPRLIDRAPIINLDLSSEIAHNIVGKKLDGAVHSSLMKKLFIPDEAELSKANSLVLKQVIEQLSVRDSKLGNPVHISKRKVNAITNYCAVVGSILDSEVALDFAIEQHILPHIEGYGLGFKKRLGNLQTILGRSYPRSTAQIERILASGNEFTSSFSYF